MKVIIENFTPPFFLAHGGAQIQILRTAEALRGEGVEVELARWWDDRQSADLIHCFGAPDSEYIRMAGTKGIPVVNTTLFTSTCNRSPGRLRLQGRVVKSLLAIPAVMPWSMIRGQLKWEAFRKCACNVVGLEAEANVLRTVYSVPDEQIRIVPLGLADEFINAGHGARNGDYLISTGTITPRKRSLELARMAREAEVPICFVGKPYDEGEDYWSQFKKCIDGKFVRYVSHTESLDEMIRLLQSARGYVLFSDYENWCLSAHEAIACGLPILVPDQPWSRERFGGEASYFGHGGPDENARTLRQFWDSLTGRAVPDVNLHSWTDVARELVRVYRDTISGIAVRKPS